ncbi:MAG: transglycosylase domain-containing protein [Myxococcales bacterium]|nr:transglycosylase domain-containing protein [Myxococcales bacterium]
MALVHTDHKRQTVQSAVFGLPKRRRWPIALALVLLIGVGGIAVTYVQLQRYAERKVGERLTRIAERYGLVLTHGDVDLRTTSGELSVAAVRVVDPVNQLVLIDRVRIETRFRVLRWWPPKAAIDVVTLRGGVSDLPKDAKTLRETLRRLRQRRARAGRHRGTSSSLSLRGATIVLDDLRVAFDNLQLTRAGRTLASISGTLRAVPQSDRLRAEFRGFLYPDVPHRYEASVELDLKTLGHHGELRLPDGLEFTVRGNSVRLSHLAWSGLERIVLKGLRVGTKSLGPIRTERIILSLGKGRAGRLSIDRVHVVGIVAQATLPPRSKWRVALVELMSPSSTVTESDPSPAPKRAGRARFRRLLAEMEKRFDMSHVSFRLSRGRFNLLREGRKEPWYFLHSTSLRLLRKAGPLWRYKLDTVLTNRDMSSAVVHVDGLVDIAKRSLDGNVLLDDFKVPRELTKRKGGLRITGKPQVTLKGKLVARLRSPFLRFDGQLKVDGVTVVSPWVAEEPMPLKPLDVKGYALFDRKKERIALRADSIAYGDITAKAGLTVRFDQLKPVLNAYLRLPKQDCHKAIHSIPEALLPKLEKSVFRGTGSLDMQAQIDWNRLRSSKTWISIDADVEDCQAVTLGPEVNVQKLDTNTYIHRVEFEDKTIEVGPGTDQWFELKKMPQFVPVGAIMTEDRAFKIHKGINVNLIRRALILNLERHRYVYGGSTISQQLVKNLFLFRHKTLARKLSEVIIVWQMELALSKDRIMELYLNCIEYGPGIYGIKEAAKRYFGKKVDELTPLEVSFLMGLKPSPKAGWYQFKRGVVNWRWQRKLGKIMKRLYEQDAITKEQFESASPYRLKFEFANLQKKPSEQRGSGVKETPVELKKPYL